MCMCMVVIVTMEIRYVLYVYGSYCNHGDKVCMSLVVIVTMEIRYVLYVCGSYCNHGDKVCMCVGVIVTMEIRYTPYLNGYNNYQRHTHLISMVTITTIDIQ